MTSLPHPTTATLASAASLAPQPIRPYASSTLRWLHQKFDLFDSFEDDESPSTAGDDLLTQEHEYEEKQRRLAETGEEKAPEMSRMNVPVLPHEEEERDSGGGKSAKKIPKEEARRKRPAKAPSSAQQPTPTNCNPSPERMLVPTPPSPMTTPFLLIGSEFLHTVKIRISPISQECVAKDLQEAMSDNFFKVWQTLEDERSGRGAKGAMEESGVYMANMGEEGKKRREQLMREWKLKGERSVQGRRGVEEGWESVFEGGVLRGVEGFRPTLVTCVEEVGREDGKEKGKGEKSRESMRRSTRGKDAQASGHHRGRKLSRAGTKEKRAEQVWRKENRPTPSLSQSKSDQGSKIGSSKAPANPIAKLRPW